MLSGAKYTNFRCSPLVLARKDGKLGARLIPSKDGACTRFDPGKLGRVGTLAARTIPSAIPPGFGIARFDDPFPDASDSDLVGCVSAVRVYG